VRGGFPRKKQVEANSHRESIGSAMQKPLFMSLNARVISAAVGPGTLAIS
jgi:hypothetical protein